MAVMAEDEAWALSGHPNGDSRSLVRLRLVDGQWRVTAVVLLADDITSRTVRSAHPTNWPRILQSDPVYAERLRSAVTPELEALSGAIEDAYASQDRGMWKRMREQRAKTPKREPLTRPDGSDPTRHYANVAAAYLEAVRDGKAPAPAMAEEAGVPVATARGWIRETRRRGLLPPGRRGRVG